MPFIGGAVVAKLLSKCYDSRVIGSNIDRLISGGGVVNIPILDYTAHIYI